MKPQRIRKRSVSKFLSPVSLLVGLFAVSASGAEKLWDNGNPDNGQYLGWGQYSSTLDDFYVPSGGWFIERVETIGIWLNESDVVTEVDVYVWLHDYDENEPDGDNIIPLNVGTNFTAEMTGNEVEGYNEIKITANFGSEYLPGQEYYWIEVVVRNQHGHENFRFRARTDISNNPAWLNIGPGAGNSTVPSDEHGISRDLSFSLYGVAVKSKFTPRFPKFHSGETSEVEVYTLDISDKKDGDYLVARNPHSGNSLEVSLRDKEVAALNLKDRAGRTTKAKNIVYRNSGDETTFATPPPLPHTCPDGLDLRCVCYEASDGSTVCITFCTPTTLVFTVQPGW